MYDVASDQNRVERDEEQQDHIRDQPIAHTPGPQAQRAVVLKRKRLHVKTWKHTCL